MLRVKLVYQKLGENGGYDEWSVTGIKVPNWFCCLLFHEEISEDVRSHILEKFLEDFYFQLTATVSDDIRDNNTAIIYIHNPITNTYERIYQFM